MKRWITSIVMMTTLLGIGLTIFPAVAEDDNKLSVPVAFGRGLNTAQPGNLVNHVYAERDRHEAGWGRALSRGRIPPDRRVQTRNET